VGAASKAFQKEYWALSEEERTALIMKSRREWWEGMGKRLQEKVVEAEPKVTATAVVAEQEGGESQANQSS
jgi:hypothetical protein